MSLSPEVVHAHHGKIQRRRRSTAELAPAREPAISMSQVLGTLSRAAIEAANELSSAYRTGDPQLIRACAIALGISSDKAILADVRCQNRPVELGSLDLDAARARQQAIDDEIAKRKADLLRKGATDTVEITPQLLEELDKPVPEPEG